MARALDECRSLPTNRACLPLAAGVSGRHGAGGFDVVLGNPPWERIKLQEQEFFAAREPDIAQAPNAAARGRMIGALKAAETGTRERALYDEFETAKRIAEASSVFARFRSRWRTVPADRAWRREYLRSVCRAVRESGECTRTRRSDCANGNCHGCNYRAVLRCTHV